MNGLRATAIEELCQTLGLRTPFGVANAAELDLREPASVPPLTDEQLTALGVLANPEAIAVVTLWPMPQPFGAPVPVVHVIATRGPWLAEHRIEGDAHHLHAADADNAAILLLDRSGVLDPAHATYATHRPINVTLGAYRRACELARVNDHRRAVAALVSEGAPVVAAEAFVAALRTGITEVAGLSSDGRRFVGCDLAFAGDARTGRWLVPPTLHSEPTAASFQHPSMTGVRVVLDPVDSDDLVDELSLVFGDV